MLEEALDTGDQIVWMRRLIGVQVWHIWFCRFCCEMVRNIKVKFKLNNSVYTICQQSQWLLPHRTIMTANKTLHPVTYHKIRKYLDTWKNCRNYPKTLNNVALPQNNEPKRCRPNGKQCRPWSDCSSCLSLHCLPMSLSKNFINTVSTLCRAVQTLPKKVRASCDDFKDSQDFKPQPLERGKDLPLLTSSETAVS